MADKPIPDPEEDERILSGQARDEDVSIEASLRPRLLDEYIGQDRIKENLRIAIAAAKKRGEPLDHVLLYGPPGLGKTTLASIIANEMGAQARVTSGPAIERAGDLAAILTNLEATTSSSSTRSTASRAPSKSPLSGDGGLRPRPRARQRRRRPQRPLNMPRFTLVGATTRYAMISPPLRDRFGAVYRLDYYDLAALERHRPAVGRVLACRSKSTASKRSHAAPEARLESPTACCDGSATTPRSWPAA